MSASFKDYVKEFEAGLTAEELAAFNTFRGHYQAENERLENEKLDILAELYLESTSMAARVAKLCDEKLDKSGALLGRVRERVQDIRERELSDTQKPDAATTQDIGYCSYGCERFGVSPQCPSHGQQLSTEEATTDKKLRCKYCGGEWPEGCDCWGGKGQPDDGAMSKPKKMSEKKLSTKPTLSDEQGATPKQDVDASIDGPA